jgi:hypothetical protein
VFYLTGQDCDVVVAGIAVWSLLSPLAARASVKSKDVVYDVVV